MEAKVKSLEQIPNDHLLRRLLWGVLALVIVSIVGANIWSAVHQESATQSESVRSLSRLAVHHPTPEFSATDQHGTSRSLSDFRGKVWVADFIFTNCVTICPLMTDKMARLQEEFAADDVYFVSFSVDPERDTPEVLAQYAERYGADPNRWFFLTGEKESIYRLAHEGFHLAAGHQGNEILHSTRFVLIDRNAQIRSYYDSRSQANLQQLRRDIKTLIEK